MKRDLCYILSDEKTDITKIISSTALCASEKGIDTEKIINSVLNKTGVRTKTPFYKSKLYRNIGAVAACFLLAVGVVTALSISGIIDLSSPEITVNDVEVNLDDKNIVWKNTAETGAALDTSAFNEEVIEIAPDTKRETFAAVKPVDSSTYSISWNGILVEPAFFFIIEDVTDENAVFALLAGKPTESAAEIYDPDKAKNDHKFFDDLGIPVMFDEEGENVFIFVTKSQLASLADCKGIENFRFSQATRDDVGYHEDIAIEPELDGADEPSDDVEEPSKNEIYDDGIVTMVTEGVEETVRHEAVDEESYDTSEIYSDETGMWTPAYDPNK